MTDTETVQEEQVEQVEQQVEEQVEAQVEEPVAVSAEEAKARSKGWVGRDEWVESGKNADDWVSFNHFNEKGEMISNLMNLQKQVKNFDQRITDNNEYWKTQIEIQRNDLMGKRDEAIDLADKEQVKAIDKQIEALNKQEQSIVSEPEVKNEVSEADLAVENEYFQTLDTRAKKATAQQIAAELLPKGLSGKSLVDAIEREMRLEFPVINHNREKAPVTDTKTPKAKAKQDEITPDKLTSADKTILNAMRRTNKNFANKTDSEMLKIMRDARK